MGTTGLFTRVNAHDAARKVGRASRDPVFAAALAGPAAVKNMNPEAERPNMEPLFDDDLDVMFLYPSPPRSVDEDGDWQSRVEDDGYAGHCSSKWGVDACVRTRPPRGRAPNAVELAAYRKTVQDNLVASGASVVVAVGLVPFRFFFPDDQKEEMAYRGVPLPYVSDWWTGWVIPVCGHHRPDQIARVKLQVEELEATDAEGANFGRFKYEQMRDEWDALQRMDLAQVDDYVRRPVPKGHTYFKNVWDERVHITSLKKLKAYPVEQFRSVIGLDIETTGGRPFAKGGNNPRIRSIAISDGRHTVALPVRPSGDDEYERSAWQRGVKKFIKKAVAGRRVTVHNLNHDLEWLLTHIDDGLVERAKEWHCTMIGEWQMDQRTQRSLGFLSVKYLGDSFKGITGEGKDSWRTTDVDQLLSYNAADALAHLMVHVEQRTQLKACGLWKSYRQRVRRDPALVRMQIKGVPVSQKVFKKLDTRYTKEIKKIDKAIAKLDCAKDFEAQYGVAFNPNKNEHMFKMFKHILDHDVKPKSKFDKNWLKEFALIEPLAKQISLRRIASKAITTYVTRFLAGHPKSHVYDDGRIHCLFSQIGTDTGRLACREPNNQNWPKRGEGKRVRAGLRARKGYVIAAFDYGQIEARVMGMASRDKKFCKALRTDYDIHAYWAQRIRDECPGILKTRRMNEDQHRTATKNEMVFPWIYGSGDSKVAKACMIPIEVAKKLKKEFWTQYPSLRQWQKVTLKFYEENNYVETLTGFRRYGPLGYNQILNTPFQGTAADFTIEAMYVLSKLAVKRKMPWLQPIINIHDDLTFEIPKKKLKSATKIIVTAMLQLRKRFPFINVPLTSDVEVGPDLYNMKKIGKYSSAHGLRNQISAKAA